MIVLILTVFICITCFCLQNFKRVNNLLNASKSEHLLYSIIIITKSKVCVFRLSIPFRSISSSALQKCPFPFYKHLTYLLKSSSPCCCHFPRMENRHFARMKKSNHIKGCISKVPLLNIFETCTLIYDSSTSKSLCL